MKYLLMALLCLVLSGCQKAQPLLPPETTLLAVQETILPTAAATEETTAPTVSLPEPEDDAFVKVTDYLPGVQVELMYATEENFTGQVIYGFQDAWLRYGTVKKLQKVQEFLASQGLSLKIWDAFRPVSAQFALWEACPDGNFVANPNTTYSSHSRGNTVDLTIVDGDGIELEMPTGFDDFSPLADRDYSDCSLVTAENARLLQSILEQNGFTGYRKEWWHFTDTDTYPVETELVLK